MIPRKLAVSARVLLLIDVCKMNQKRKNHVWMLFLVSLSVLVAESMYAQNRSRIQSLSNTVNCPAAQYGTSTKESSLADCLRATERALANANYELFDKSGNTRIGISDSAAVAVVCTPISTDSTVITFSAFSTDSKTAEVARNTIRTAILNDQPVASVSPGTGTRPMLQLGVSEKSASMSTCLAIASKEMIKAGYTILEKAGNPIIGKKDAVIMEIACSRIDDNWTTISFVSLSSDDKSAELARNSVRTAVLNSSAGASQSGKSPSGPLSNGPVITEVKISPDTDVSYAQKVQLSWKVSNYTKVEIAPAIQVISVQGRVLDNGESISDLTPLGNNRITFLHKPHPSGKKTDYTLTFTGPTGAVAIRKVTVTNRQYNL